MRIYLTNIFKWLISFAGVDGCNRCSCTKYGATCTKYVFSSFCYWPVFSSSLTKYLQKHNACVMRMILILNLMMTLMLTLTSITIAITNLIIPSDPPVLLLKMSFLDLMLVMIIMAMLMILLVMIPMMMVMMLKSGGLAVDWKGVKMSMETYTSRATLT